MNKINNQQPAIIFGLSNGIKIAKKVSELIKIELGEVKTIYFADGEILVKPNTSVRNKHTFVVQSTTRLNTYKSVNDSIMELLIFIDALKRANAKTINVVIPYYGYARQDRKSQGREPISARLVANLLETAGATRLTIFDLHSRQIQGFFNIPVDDLRGMPIIFDYIKARYVNELNNFVIVSPDQGGIKYARVLAEYMNLPFACVDKRRVGPNQVKIYGILGSVKNKIPLILDDMIDTAGTISKASKYLYEKSDAKPAIICATHGLFNGNAAKNLNDKEYIREIIVTNTINCENKKQINNLKIINIEGFLSQILQSWLQGKSISLIYKKYLKEFDV